ncbi:MAG: peptide chain release factor 2 [bacterium]
MKELIGAIGKIERQVEEIEKGLIEKIKRKETLEKEETLSSFWDSPNAGKKIKELKDLRDFLSPYLKVLKEKDELKDLLSLGEDPEILDELNKKKDNLLREIEEVKFLYAFSGKHDKDNAIISIHPGAGGTESCDWAAMLFRMYLRWAETKGYKTRILDLLAGDETGISSVVFIIEGRNAYGWLKGEKGIHRLVRISPFDANKRRHTSFASVFVMPEITDPIEVDIKDEDLKIDTFRSSAPGGQHVQKTESAIRITHIPTGIVVSSQNERSQHQNKANALKVLYSRLYEYYEEKRQEDLQKIGGEKKAIGWGSQIRSYVFCPYTMVKDHRTGEETGNIKGVMDGEIDCFLKAELLLGI